MPFASASNPAPIGGLASVGFAPVVSSALVVVAVVGLGSSVRRICSCPVALAAAVVAAAVS